MCRDFCRFLSHLSNLPGHPLHLLHDSHRCWRLSGLCFAMLPWSYVIIQSPCCYLRSSDLLASSLYPGRLLRLGRSFQGVEIDSLSFFCSASILLVLQASFLRSRHHGVFIQDPLIE